MDTFNGKRFEEYDENSRDHRPDKSSSTSDDKKEPKDEKVYNQAEDQPLEQPTR